MGDALDTSIILIYGEGLVSLVIGELKRVHPHHEFFLRIDGKLILIRGVPNLALRESRLDRLDHAAEAVDLLDVLETTLLHPIGQLLDEIRAAERIDRIDHSRLVRQDLLRAKSDAGGLLRRQRER